MQLCCVWVMFQKVFQRVDYDSFGADNILDNI